ncbi:MAG: TolC family protein, partial [Longimicrobiales bacterium]
LPLPLWNRNQGLVAEREAEATRARLELSAVELEVRTDVISAYRSYVTAAEEARIYETSVLEPARENQELLDTAFRAGKLALPSLLLLRNQLLDAELGYWDAWLALRSALVELQAATGTINDTMNDAR